MWLLKVRSESINTPKVTNLVSDCKGPSLKVFTNADPLLFATKQNDLSFVLIEL